MRTEKMEIQRVSTQRLREIIHRTAPRGLFLAKEGGRWTAVDNATGHAWTEEFRWKRQAVRWLRGAFEIGDRGKRRMIWARREGRALREHAGEKCDAG